MAFIKRVEDFVCEQCGASVQGSGYTNHCTQCLWSKHVDKDPGDRAESCGGLMEPTALEGSSPQYRIAHRCTRCGANRRVSVATDDDQDALLAIAARR